MPGRVTRCRCRRRTWRAYIPPSLSPGETADELAANLLLTNNDIDASELIWEFFDTTAR